MEEHLSLFSSLPFFFLLFLLFFFLKRQNQAKKSSTNKAPKAQSWASGIYEAIRNGHRILEWTTELLQASTSNTITTFFAIVTANPSNVEHMAKINFHNYPKGKRILECSQDLLGHGIFNSDGEHWKSQRKMASLQFSTKLLRAFMTGNVHLEISGRLIPLLRKASVEGETLDLQDVLDRLAFDNVCQVTCDVDPAYLAGAAAAEEWRRFSRAFDDALTRGFDRFQCPPLLWKIKRLFNVGSERRLRESISTVHAFADKVVRSKRMAAVSGLGPDSSGGGGNLLSRLAAEGNYSDQTLREVIVSFIMAGRDTTSTALTWFFWLLSSSPGVEQKILEEVRHVRRRHGNSDGGGGVLNLEQLREMEYLHAALTETLRLYPVVPLEVRTSLADDVMPDGTVVRKGGVVMYNSYAMGRSEVIWGKDCGEFRPERWLDPDGVFQAGSPFRFPVFHAGPRMCLGKELVYNQMKAVAARVLEVFEVEVAEVGREKGREHLMGMLLRRKGGLPARVRERREQ